MTGSLLGAGAAAQESEPEPISAPTVSLQTGVYATDNGAFAPAGARRADAVGWLRPGLSLHRHRPRLAIDLDASAVLLGSANGTQPRDIQPDVRASLQAIVIEQWLNVDARARIEQTQTDLFGPSAVDSLTGSRRTQSSYSISPRVERALTEYLSAAARHETVLVTNGTGTGRREVLQRSSAVLTRRPAPYGGSLRWSRSDSETSDGGLSRITLDSVRATADARLGDAWVVGAAVGRDRSRYFLSDHDDPLYALELKWDPSPRTAASASLEHRFFGWGGGLSLKHRNPFVALELTAARTPVALSSALGLLGPGDDVRTLLDSILTTRYPDEAARAGVVDQLVKGMAIGAGVSSPTYLVAAYPQLLTSVNARLALLGRRQSLTLTFYALTAKQLEHRDDPLALAVPALADRRQVGASLQFDRRLNAQLSAGALVRWSRVTGLALRAGDESRETMLRAALLRRLTPRTSASIGVQTNRFSTNVAGQHPYRATMVFVGYDLRF